MPALPGPRPLCPLCGHFPRYRGNPPFRQGGPFQNISFGRLRRTRQSSGLMSTSTMSGPMRQILHQGITKSSRGPARPPSLHRPGTTMAVTSPLGSWMITSSIIPSRWPLLMQMTSLQCRSVNLADIHPPPFLVKSMRQNGGVEPY